MEADMAFKKEGAEFTDTVRFKDYALSFAAEEASRFSNEDGDVASAKVDFALSSAASLSASKHTAKIKELRRFLKSKEIKDAAGNSGTGTKGREDGMLQSTAVFKRTEAEKGSRMNTTKKQITKEKRQAARKTAVAKMLRAKGMVGNELGTEKVTGNAFRDGNSGAVRAITEILNPATYLKSLFVKIAGVIAPHTMVVLLYLSVFMILVSLIAGMFTSINTVTTTVTGFISKYSGRGSIIAEESLDEEEIDGVLIATLFTDSVSRLSRMLDIRNIPYVYVDSNIAGEHQLAYFGTESFDAGFIAAKLLTSQIGNQPDILISRIIHNGKNDSNQGRNRKEGFLQYLNENGFGGKLHEVELKIADSEYNFAKLDKIFYDNPRIEGAVIFNSTCYILGNYLKERELKNIKLVGYDLIDKNTELLSEGVITALIAQRPEQQGYNGIKSLCNHLVLKQDPEKVNLMPIDILIKENLKYYLNKKL